MKATRFIATITLVILLVVTLCSCVSKGIHVTVIDDNTLELMGNSYTKLTPDDPIIYVHQARSITVYVTEKAVPTFLSKALNNDWKSGSYMTNNGYFITYFGETYCREDVYPNLAEIVEYEYDACFYNYFSDGGKKCYDLSNEELDAINRVFEEVEPVVSYELESAPQSSDMKLLWFYNSETDIVSVSETLYIYEDGYYFTQLREDNFTDFYFVPEELEPYFDSMTRTYTEAYLLPKD